MEEFYEAIEEKIREAGYTHSVSGEDIYNELCDEIDGKENGTYIFMSKHEENVVFEYNVTIMDEEFNLSTITITVDGDKHYIVNFD